MGNLHARGADMVCPWYGLWIGVDAQGFFDELDEYEEDDKHCPHCEKPVVVSFFYGRNWRCKKGE